MKECLNLRNGLPPSTTNLEQLKLVICDEERAKFWEPIKEVLTILEVKLWLGGAVKGACVVQGSVLLCGQGSRRLEHTKSQICTVASDRTFETISEFRIPFNFQSGYPELVGSCNGILRVADHRKFAIMDVYLWNPSIRKFKRLPDTCLTQLRTVRLGFGYDSQNNDYKVVRISWTCAKPMPPPEVEVYSLSSASWKRVELGISCRPKFNFTLTFPFVSGHLHWMITKIEGGGGQ
ncbi:F-box protein At4g22390-like [Quercus lobata]|uniref:F-box protein At4g22390-like n=1 Tax=Quercus lobata TaxID=97700 RepID=UPI00124944A5|nr:F-box protein At4g22390-like [Quercus lobata]